MPKPVRASHPDRPARPSRRKSRASRTAGAGASHPPPRAAARAEIELDAVVDGVDTADESATPDTTAATPGINSSAPSGVTRATPSTVEVPAYSLDDRRPTVMLRERAVQRLRFGALWIQNHDIERKVGYTPPAAGRTVNFVTPGGEFVAAGFFHPVSRVAGRVLHRDSTRPLDRAFFAARLRAAWDLRAALQRLHPTQAFRWVNAEGDALPGLIVDVYQPWLVVQINCAGFEAQRELILDLLVEIAQPEGILERRDSGQRRAEGLACGPAQVVRGATPPQARLWLSEAGLQFPVDLTTGQKTGLYLDQRDNRRRVGEYVRALGLKRVADLYCYSGGFGLSARAAGATQVVFVDRSAPAIDAARAAWEKNGFAAGEADFHVGAVDEFLRAVPTDTQWDLAIIDPPKLTQGSIHAHKALQFHRKVNAAALKRVRDGGMIVSCDCSGAVSLPDFQEALSQAAAEAGVRLKMLESAGGSADHPAPPGFRMGLYLKVLFLEVRRV